MSNQLVYLCTGWVGRKTGQESGWEMMMQSLIQMMNHQMY